jgi:hypothetical protein
MLPRRCIACSCTGSVSRSTRPILSQSSVVIRGERTADIYRRLLTLMSLVLHDSLKFVDLVDPPARILLCDSQNWADWYPNRFC